MNNLPPEVRAKLHEIGVLANGYVDNGKYVVVVILTGPHKARLALYETGTDDCILAQNVEVSGEDNASDEDITRWSEMCSIAINKHEGHADDIPTEDTIEIHGEGGDEDGIRFRTVVVRGAPGAGAGEDQAVAEEGQPPPGQDPLRPA